MEEKYQSPRIINIKKQYLRKMGYDDIHQWLKDPAHLYIGRANGRMGLKNSKWHNKYKLINTIDDCLKLFEEYARENLYDNLEELNSKIIGCWCKPNRCHGDILIKLFKEKFNIDTINL